MPVRARSPHRPPAGAPAGRGLGAASQPKAPPSARTPSALPPTAAGGACIRPRGQGRVSPDACPTAFPVRPPNCERVGLSELIRATLLLQSGGQAAAAGAGVGSGSHRRAKSVWGGPLQRRCAVRARPCGARPSLCPNRGTGLRERGAGPTSVLDEARDEVQQDVELRPRARRARRARRRPSRRRAARRPRSDNFAGPSCVGGLRWQ